LAALGWTINAARRNTGRDIKSWNLIIKPAAESPVTTELSKQQSAFTTQAGISDQSIFHDDTLHLLD
jgi:hypothetical protein